MHNASPEAVRYALAILSLIIRCTLLYFCMLCGYFVASIHTGDPYLSRGSIASLYIVTIAPYLNPNVSLATLARYVCMLLCMYVCMHVYMFLCMYVCIMYACMDVLFMCVCMYICVCMYECMYVCMHIICMRVCM